MPDRNKGGNQQMQVGVLVVAYNAASTLVDVLDRLPQSFKDRVAHIMVCDDASPDATHSVGLEYQRQSDLPLTVIRHPVNLGYGGNQKLGYRWAIEHGLDVVVLLHGDGQYAPEVIEDLVRPLESGDYDAVFGSRMMDKGGARGGGMPTYKYVGNRILTTFENAVAGMSLSEWHSGYRAYRVDALSHINFDANSDDFDFDTEIILQLHEAGKSIHEVPIPTYYGDEICHVDGLKYAADVVRDVSKYRLHRLGFGATNHSEADDPYELKLSPNSSHGRLIEWMARRPPSKVLDVGCSDGRFGEILRDQGHEVIGVDVVKHDGVGERLDGFFEADLNVGLPKEVGNDFDVVIAADVIEHTMNPQDLMAGMASVLTGPGVIYASVPNFAHWYPRLRVGAGRFDYDRRGILDAGHLRFFTRRSFERTARSANLRVCNRDQVGLPFEIMERGGESPKKLERFLARIDGFLSGVWPTMFGYQFLYELAPKPDTPSTQ